MPMTTVGGVPASNNYWSVYTGEVTSRVVIRDQAEARVVYNNGFFGDLVVGDKMEDKLRTVIEDWAPSLDNDRDKSENKSVTENEVETCDKMTKTVPADASNWSQIKSRSEFKTPDKPLGPAQLHLELCEAYFLSYSLGCLVVHDKDSGQSLSLAEQWRLYVKLESDFPVRYRVYHQFRSKGWCVRSGHNMGADWVLYKQSPSHYHSTYTVRIELVDDKTGQVVSDVGTRVRHVTWAELLGHTRVMGTVKKDLLVARVTVTGDLSDWEDPSCLNKMSVSTHRVRRWVPGDQRWRTKPQVPVLTLD